MFGKNETHRRFAGDMFRKDGVCMLSDTNCKMGTESDCRMCVIPIVCINSAKDYIDSKKQA